MFDVGETLELNIVFRDWQDGSPNFGEPIDPEDVLVFVYPEGIEEATPHEDQATREDVGVYSYEFTPSYEGIYDIEFRGIFENTISQSISTIAVGVAYEATSLTGDNEITFIADLEPIYVDPEELLLYHPDVDPVEVVTLIHRYSKEVDQLLKGAEPGFKATEYIRAAVMCALARTYDFAIGGGGVADSFTLGDLSVSKETSSGRPGGHSVNRGSAETPCELAYVLRQELVRGTANMRAVKAGSRRPNPMPKRQIRHAERYF